MVWFGARRSTLAPSWTAVKTPAATTFASSAWGTSVITPSRAIEALARPHSIASAQPLGRWAARQPGGCASEMLAVLTLVSTLVHPLGTACGAAGAGAG